jgi:hypothetical protein
MTRDVVSRLKQDKPPAKKLKALNERCEVRVDGCWGRATHRHHIKRRSQGVDNHPSNLLGVCAWCHAWVHNNVAAAKVAGWLA